MQDNKLEMELIELTRKLLTETGEMYRRDIKTDSSLQRHLGIDSLGRAELFRRIEIQYDITIPDKLLAEAENLDDIITFLRAAKPSMRKPAAQKVMASHGARPHLDLHNAQSLVDVLRGYGEHDPEKTHIYFQHENGSDEVISYGSLLQKSQQVAFSLREHGLKEGESVAIMLPTTPDFFYSFFGIMLAGGIPVPIYPPFRMHMLEVYAKTEARILRNAEVRLLITFDQATKLSRLLKGFVPSLRDVFTISQLLKPQSLDMIASPRFDDAAFIQYTSGSTSDPKGVLLSHGNLLSNIRAYGKAIDVKPDDVTVSWLPLYHDFGLIGSWLGSLYYGAPLILMTPFTFLNHPERWLWAIHYHRGTVSCAPNFAYELCVRKIDVSRIEGLDLSSWRIAANGAEKIYPHTLKQFTEKFAPFGFKKSAMTPVYGLAESTVGLTIPPMERGYIIDRIDRKVFEEEQRAKPTDEKNALEFVSCGKPIEGHDIRIVDENDEDLPERHVGSLLFKGPSNMQGYYNNPRATQATIKNGWIDSGDLAYIADGELYLAGRRKDLIVKAGRNLYPAEIEELVGNVEGIRQGCVAVFGVNSDKDGTEELIVVAETREKKKLNKHRIMNRINDVIATSLDMSPDHIKLVAPRCVPKTSSGKLQRAQCKQMYLDNKLGKFPVPTSLQMVKLALEWGVRQVWHGLGVGLKVIYTSYAALIVAIITVFMYLSARFTSGRRLERLCKFYSKLLMLAIFSPAKVLNEEKLISDTPVIYVANHASYIDAIIASAILPYGTRYVAKKEVFSWPVLGTILTKLNHFPVDRTNFPKGLDDTLEIQQALKDGSSILIFPEGTFNYAEGMRPFRLGAFKIASDAGVPIVPFAIKGARKLLRDGSWLMRPIRLVVTVCDPIMPKGKEWQDITTLRQTVRASIAKYCGEACLDLIAASQVAPSKPKKNKVRKRKSD